MALVYLDDVVVCELVDLFRSRRVGRSIGTLTFFLEAKGNFFIVAGFSIIFSVISGWAESQGENELVEQIPKAGGES